MDDYDLIIIGAGPGGYVAALRAAQKGLKVACIEKEKTLGGTCLNVGCIPSKALLHATELVDRTQGWGKEMGIQVEKLSVDFPHMIKKKGEIVKRLVDGVAFLFEKNKVHWIKGEGSFVSSHEIQIKGETTTVIKGKNILLATGSEPIALPGTPFDETQILSSTGALALQEIPQTLVIVGGGVIGLELGSVYQRLGTKVTVVEMLDRLCPAFDEEISQEVLKIFQKKGWTFHLSSKVKSIEKGANSCRLQVEKQNGEMISLEASKVLVSIGRRPFTKGLNLEKAGITPDAQGRVVVDSAFRTSQPHIFAIGDLIEGPMLAHKASDEGLAVIDFITNGSCFICYPAIPNVMYTAPEVACVGLTQKQAQEMGLEVAVGKFPFRANARARCSGEEEGFVKIIAEKKTQKLIGMHILGPFASEMIGEGVLAIQQKMVVQEIVEAPHAHPTYTEAIKESGMGTFGKRLHFL